MQHCSRTELEGAIEYLKDAAKARVAEVIASHEANRVKVRDVLQRMYADWKPEERPIAPRQIMRDAMIRIDDDIDAAQEEIFHFHGVVIKIVEGMLGRMMGQDGTDDPPCQQEEAPLVPAPRRPKHGRIPKDELRARRAKPKHHPLVKLPAASKLPKNLTQEMLNVVLLNLGSGMSSAALYAKMDASDNPKRKHSIRRCLDWLSRSGQIAATGAAKARRYAPAGAQEA